ncbi:ABC transporter ATP-binding protein [Halobium salinum]|uniref:ABC transporter ATP-binding protein n=1 Tax=Halobium salinum TaxID=1364940 RepID=A0ABD5PDW2_9EURY|nr:ABC transporter ATP-binding protein [Halobium salinum]
MPAIETGKLTKYYGDTLGVEDLSLTVESGEVFGFLGPNGAGKTTTIRTLLGLQAPTSGTARVLGHDVTDERELIEARKRIGYLPSDPGFDDSVTGRRLLDYYASLRGDTRSEELLERFTPPLDRKVGEYSRGNRQMLAIVLAFMHDPDLVVMDEPTSGLDPLKQEQFLAFLESERERGKTLFFSSHILGEVQKVCDRVGIVRDGRLVELEDVRTLLDRSGKVVRVRVAGTPTLGAFDGPDVHDLQVSGTAESDGGSEDTGDYGDHDDHGDQDGATDTTAFSFTYTGGFGPLLRRLLEFDVQDLTVEDAPLEDVFMRFYGASGDAPAEISGDASTTGTPADATATTGGDRTRGGGAADTGGDA